MTLVAIPSGYLMYDGPHKVAVVDTNQQVTDPRDLTKEQLLHRDRNRASGPVYWKEMPRESWTVHLTSPQWHADKLAEVVAALPKAASPVKPPDAA